MHAEDGCRSHSYTRETHVPEHDPQSNPTCGTTYVDRVAHVAVEPNDHQPLWRGDRSRCAVPRPPEDLLLIYGVSETCTYLFNQELISENQSVAGWDGMDFVNGLNVTNAFQGECS